MISIQVSAIPEHLRNGFFYRSLESQDNSDECIEVPAKCFRLDENEAHSVEDFIQELQVMTFWGLDVISQKVMSFCFKNELTVWDKDAVEVLGQQSEVYECL